MGIECFEFSSKIHALFVWFIHSREFYICVLLQSLNRSIQLLFWYLDRYLDYGEAEWKQQANAALKSLET